MNNRLIIRKFYNFSKNKLYLINRSITGKGVKKTLLLLKNEFPNFKIKKIKSGKKVFDWKIPSEWNVSEAYIKDPNGKTLIDFKKNNLHLMSYSIPIKKKVTRDKLLKHLYSIKKYPDAIPYITSYYNKNWGFSLSHREKSNLIKKYKKSEKLFCKH